MARMTLRDAFRKIKKYNPDYLLAFGLGDFFEFRYCDAKTIHSNFPDILLDGNVEYDKITVHKLGFFQFCARLVAKGLKILVIARTIENGKERYEISMRSDE